MDGVVEAVIKTIPANNVTDISSTNVRGHFLHIDAPRIYEDLQSKPIKSVGNVSKSKGNSAW